MHAGIRLELRVTLRAIDAREIETFQADFSGVAYRGHVRRKIAEQIPGTEVASQDLEGEIPLRSISPIQACP